MGVNGALARPNINSVSEPSNDRAFITFSGGHSNRHSVDVELMVFVVAALTGAQMLVVVNEFDCLQPLEKFASSGGNVEKACTDSYCWFAISLGVII